jgi:hypothetical protein
LDEALLVTKKRLKWIGQSLTEMAKGRWGMPDGRKSYPMKSCAVWTGKRPMPSGCAPAGGPEREPMEDIPEKAS